MNKRNRIQYFSLDMCKSLELRRRWGGDCYPDKNYISRLAAVMKEIDPGDLRAYMNTIRILMEGQDEKIIEGTQKVRLLNRLLIQKKISNG